MKPVIFLFIVFFVFYFWLKFRPVIAKIIYIMVAYYALHITLSFNMVINSNYFTEVWDYIYVIGTKIILYGYLLFIFLMAKKMSKNQIIKGWYLIGIFVSYGLMWWFIFLERQLTSNNKVLAESFLSDIPYVYGIVSLFLIFLPIYSLLDKIFFREKH